MTEVSNRKRQPKGAPASTGGEFTGNSHDEASSPLSQNSGAGDRWVDSLPHMSEEDRVAHASRNAVPDFYSFAPNLHIDRARLADAARDAAEKSIRVSRRGGNYKTVVSGIMDEHYPDVDPATRSAAQHAVSGVVENAHRGEEMMARALSAHITEKHTRSFEGSSLYAKTGTDVVRGVTRETISAMERHEVVDADKIIGEVSSRTAMDYLDDDERETITAAARAASSDAQFEQSAVLESR